MFKVLLPGGSPKRVSPLGWEACLERKIRMRLLPVPQVPQAQPQPQAQQESLEESFQPADQPADQLADQPADQLADQPAEQQPLTAPMDFRSLI